LEYSPIREQLLQKRQFAQVAAGHANGHLA